MMRFAIFAGFVATIPAANWLIGNVGTVCILDGPCLIPVAPGMMAPSGVLMAGLALVLRDALHELAGSSRCIAAIIAGGVLSLAVSAPEIALASAVAFTLAELADLAVYAPLRRRGLALAVMASGVVGAVADSALFLALAFGSLDLIGGQVVAKLYASAAVALVLTIRRRAAA